MAPLDKDSLEYKRLKALVVDGIRHAGSRKALAGWIGVVPGTIIGWIKDGSDPSSETRKKLEEYVRNCELKERGFIADPASVEYRTYPPTDHISGGLQPITVIGAVEAGNLSMSDPADVEDLGFDDLWRDSPWWSHTDAASPVLLLRVRGNSMSPTYPHNSWIAVRKPSDVKQLPNGAPCVMQEGTDEATFKLLMHKEGGGVSGLPLNQDFPLINFKKPTITYVALGCVQPRMTISLSFQPPAPAARIAKKRK